MIRTLTPGPAVVEAALSSRGLHLRFLPHKSAAVTELPGRRLSQHEITTQVSLHLRVCMAYKCNSCVVCINIHGLTTT